MCVIYSLFTGGALVKSKHRINNYIRKHQEINNGKRIQDAGGAFKNIGCINNLIILRLLE